MPGYRVCIHSFGLTMNAPHLPPLPAQARARFVYSPFVRRVYLDRTGSRLYSLIGAGQPSRCLASLLSSPLLLCIPNYGAEFRARDNRGFSLISSLNRVISEPASTFPPRIHAKTYPFSQLYPPASNLSPSKFSIPPFFEPSRFHADAAEQVSFSLLPLLV